MGYVDEKEKIKTLTSPDIYILPSPAEGLPISILEAMSAGLAVISTNVGAIPEVIENGVNGYLIEKGDYKNLAEKILTLANNRELLDTMSLNNSEKVKRTYDLNKVISKMDDLYDSISSSK